MSVAFLGVFPEVDQLARDLLKAAKPDGHIARDLLKETRSDKEDLIRSMNLFTDDESERTSAGFVTADSEGGCMGPKYG